MSHASLATRHRPQTFSEVTGQGMIKTILSRAAARDNVAPAYLFSGTRGVGKTTLARIFAKTLNCINAPTGEPCNICDQCRRITQGNHVDVVEIDGASNTGVDDARRLKETIGYAPMEGRYKVFIIDEAHMLSRNAFNALLKTLEEPPPRVVFIMATTEPHKFPATIVSRCQHFVFQAQPERELVEHLRQILEKEGLGYEPAALRLIARRAAGSVRDSMSLMGQTLALGGNHLDEAITREVLGVAGQEAYERLLRAIVAEDCPAVVTLTRELLERGIDIGFFLRELATLWRNLFLIRQAGAAASQALDLPDDEQQRLAELAPAFDLTFIHAAWQMVLESQRQVLTSLEPAASLELLLLNLTLLPRLVSLETLSAAQTLPAPPAEARPKAPVEQPKQAEPIPAPQPVAAAPPAEPAPSASPVRNEADTRPAPPAPQKAPSRSAPATPDWVDFLNFCSANKALCGPITLGQLRQAKGSFTTAGLSLVTLAEVQCKQFSAPAYIQALRDLLEAYIGVPTSVQVLPPEKPILSEAAVKEEMAERPQVQALAQTFDAQLIRCLPLEQPEGDQNA